MFDPDKIESENEDTGRSSWLVRGISFVLLAAMLCGMISAPVALYIRWQREQESPPAQEEPVASEPLKTIEVVKENDSRLAIITLDDQLVTMDADGSDQRKISNGDIRYSFPAWSPDGNQIAVIGDDSLYLYDDVEYEENPVGKRLYSNSTERPFYLYWSPDSRHLSFLANHPQGIALHLSSLIEDESEQLAVGQPFYWDWSPDSDQILVHVGSFNVDSRLSMLDALGEESAASFAEPGRFQAPGISNSGEYWAFAERTQQDSSRIVIRDQNLDAQLIEPHFGQVYMNWSPVSDKLAYASPPVGSRSRFGPLRLFDLKSGETSVIVSGQVVAFFWSNDGQKIAYLTLAEPAPGAIQALATNRLRFSRKVALQHPEIELNLQLYDLENGETRWLTTFSPTPTYVTQFLPYFDQYALSHKIWSPDNDYLAIPMDIDGTAMISIVAVQDGVVHSQSEGKIGFWRPN